MNLELEGLLARLAEASKRAIEERSCEDPVVIGIHTGGVWIAEKLHKMLGIKTPLCRLSVNFYRDDFNQGGIHTQSKPSNMEADINDRHVVLVDDVLQTGRTIRAALNETFDYGRPRSVLLAVLVTRKQKELPICADAVGVELDLKLEQTIKLRGPEPLRLEINQSSLD